MCSHVLQYGPYACRYVFVKWSTGNGVTMGRVREFVGSHSGGERSIWRGVVEAQSVGQAHMTRQHCVIDFYPHLYRGPGGGQQRLPTVYQPVTFGPDLVQRRKPDRSDVAVVPQTLVVGSCQRKYSPG